MPLLIAGDVLALTTLVPQPAACLAAVRSPQDWVARHGADAATAQLAGAALWLVACWVALGLLALAVRTAPGAVGRGADALARVVLPHALYRAAAGAAGLGVLLAPAAATAGPVAGQPAAPAPMWPSDAPLHAPQWPTSPAASTGMAGPSPSTPSTPAKPGPASIPAGPSLAHAVVVRPGDTLWSIAAGHLPAQADSAAVARAWPRWYGANRTVIGADPDLIRPGTVLTVPEAGTQP